MEFLLGPITRRINVLYESWMKWTWHHSKLAVEEVSFFGGLRVVLLQLLSIHDRAVGIKNLGVLLLWTRDQSDQWFACKCAEIAWPIKATKVQKMAGIKWNMTKNWSGLGSTKMNVSTKFETSHPELVFFLFFFLEMCGKQQYDRKNKLTNEMYGQAHSILRLGGGGGGGVSNINHNITNPQNSRKHWQVLWKGLCWCGRYSEYCQN